MTRFERVEKFFTKTHGRPPKEGELESLVAKGAFSYGGEVVVDLRILELDLYRDEIARAIRETYRQVHDQELSNSQWDRLCKQGAVKWIYFDKDGTQLEMKLLDPYANPPMGMGILKVGKKVAIRFFNV